MRATLPNWKTKVACGGFAMDLPAYETRRLILSPSALADVDDMVAMHQDPTVMRHVGAADPDRHAVAAEARAWILQTCDKGLGYWTVRLKGADRRYLGWVMLLPLDDEGPEIEIGWRFAASAWGKGYATEAARRILAHGFRLQGLSEIVAVMEAANRASIRLAERVGMKRGGTRFAYGERLLLYRLSRRDFNALGA